MALLGPHSSIIFGLLGNIVSFLVYLADLRQDIQGKINTKVPINTIFSAMLLLYYAFLKVNAFMILTINTVGVVIESIYLIVYMIYATKSTKIFTTQLLLLFNIGAFGLIVLFTYLFSVGYHRLTIVGWICAVFSVYVFDAPLETSYKDKERRIHAVFTIFLLDNLCCNVLLYGLSIHDYFIATPNVMGLGFGATQIILYFIYRKRRNELLPVVDPKEKANGISTSTAQNQYIINSNGL